MDRLPLPGRASLFTAAGLTLLAAISLMASPTLHAAQVPQQRVRISDLDLSTSEGQRILGQRVGAAIHAVCVEPGRKLPRSRPVVEGMNACQAAALGSVRRQLADKGLRPSMRVAQVR